MNNSDNYKAMEGIVDQDLSIQLRWVYARENGRLRNIREPGYHYLLSHILDRSRIPKLEFLLLAWVYENNGNYYEVESIAPHVGMSKSEVEQNLKALEEKGFLVYHSDRQLKVIQSQIDNYYEGQVEDGETVLVETKSVETENLIISDLQKMAMEYIKEGYFSFGPSRLENFAERNPDAQLAKGYKQLFPSLTHDEQKGLLFLAGYFAWKGVVPFDYDDSSDEYEVFDSLVQKGLALVYPQEVGKDDERPDNRIILSYKVCKALFYGHRELVRYSSLSQQAEVIKYEEISEKELYYEPQDQNTVDTLMKIVSEERFLEVTKRLRQKGRNTGISVMLHGGPGVGKTELIKQLARRSQRDIFNIDVSKIYGSLWGETEKNVRAVFRNFRYMTAICPTAPILLFNEADGLMMRRGVGDGSSVSRGEDIIQTIILQEMEAFEGFFFATTNLMDNIDKAFIRRFLFKLEVHSPGQKTRARIWGAMIPNLDEKLREYLAGRYSFSGGQIENIARRKDIFEALEGRTPTKAEIERFCEEEGSQNEKHNKIGFVIRNCEEKIEPSNKKHVTKIIHEN